MRVSIRVNKPSKMPRMHKHVLQPSINFSVKDNLPNEALRTWLVQDGTVTNSHTFKGSLGSKGKIVHPSWSRECLVYPYWNSYLNKMHAQHKNECLHICKQIIKKGITQNNFIQSVLICKITIRFKNINEHIIDNWQHSKKQPFENKLHLSFQHTSCQQAYCHPQKRFLSQERGSSIHIGLSCNLQPLRISHITTFTSHTARHIVKDNLIIIK